MSGEYGLLSDQDTPDGQASSTTSSSTSSSSFVSEYLADSRIEPEDVLVGAAVAQTLVLLVWLEVEVLDQ